MELTGRWPEHLLYTILYSNMDYCIWTYNYMRNCMSQLHWKFLESGSDVGCSSDLIIALLLIGSLCFPALLLRLSLLGGNCLFDIVAIRGCILVFYLVLICCWCNNISERFNKDIIWILVWLT